ncbi:MAG: hypothetical protein ACJ789_17230 [Thermomicrobiales bacterium]
MPWDTRRRTTDNRTVPTQVTPLLARIEETGASLARAHELIARSWRLLEPKPPSLLHDWQQRE